MRSSNTSSYVVTAPPAKDSSVPPSALLVRSSISRWSALDWALLAVTWIVALAYDFHSLGTATVSWDEAFSFQLARQSTPTVLLSLWGSGQNMALHYLFLHGWLVLLQIANIAPTEFALRTSSAIFAALSVVVVFLIGRRFWGRAAGMVGAALYLFSYLQFYASHQARGYAMEMFLLCFSWFALLRALTDEDQRSQRWWWVGYSVAAALAVYTHLWSGLIIASQGTFFVLLLALPGSWHETARRSLRQAIASAVAVIVLCSPIALDAALFGSQNGWVAPANPSDIFGYFMLEFADGGKWRLALVVGLVVIVLLVIASNNLPALMSLRERLLPSESRVAQTVGLAFNDPGPLATALVCWLLIPLVLSYALTQPYLNLHLFDLRYLVAIAPAFCLLVGVAVAAVRPAPGQVALGLLVVVLAWVHVASYYTALDQPIDYRTPAVWLTEHYQPGEGLACYTGDSCLQLKYYLILYHVANGLDPDAALQDGPTAQTDLTAYAAAHSRACLILPQAAQVMAAQRWFEAHGQLAGEVDGAVAVRCYTVEGS